MSTGRAGYERGEVRAGGGGGEPGRRDAHDAESDGHHHRVHRRHHVRSSHHAGADRRQVDGRLLQPGQSVAMALSISLCIIIIIIIIIIISSPLVPNLTRVDQITDIGITFNNTLSCGPHANLITAKAAASFYALKTLKSHGLSGPALWDVTQTTLLAQITYVSSSSRGFINFDEAKNLQTILNKAKRSNFLPSDFSALEELFDSADSALFRAVLTIPEHVLHPLLPPCKKTDYNLRKRSHGLMLPEAKSSSLRNNFLVRMLYTDVTDIFLHLHCCSMYRHCVCQ